MCPWLVLGTSVWGLVWQCSGTTPWQGWGTRGNPEANSGGAGARTHRAAHLSTDRAQHRLCQQRVLRARRAQDAGTGPLCQVGRSPAGGWGGVGELKFPSSDPGRVHSLPPTTARTIPEHVCKRANSALAWDCSGDLRLGAESSLQTPARPSMLCPILLGPLQPAPFCLLVSHPAMLGVGETGHRF